MDGALLFSALACFGALGVALWFLRDTSRISLYTPMSADDGANGGLADDSGHKAFDMRGVSVDEDPELEHHHVLSADMSPSTHVGEDLIDISNAIQEGAISFLSQEYRYIAVFAVCFSVLLFIVLAVAEDAQFAGLTVVAFLIGSATSAICGYIGMRVAVYSNSRTAIAATTSIGRAFVVAFKSGAVIGFGLVGLGLLMLVLVIAMFKTAYPDAFLDQESTRKLYEAIAGYGLGGSSIALFGRVGGGIFTKAADVGADLVGKLENDIPEDDARNPAVIADNVGDNVGDIAGMGSDLFGSFAEATCAAMVISSRSSLFSSMSHMGFPLLISACGILVCIGTAMLVTSRDNVVRSHTDVEPVLKNQLLVSTLVMTPVVLILSLAILPGTFTLGDKTVHNWGVFLCILSGLWSGLAIGYITEYYTSHSYAPVREVANACNTGAATNIIYGLALGYKSAIIPVVCLVATVYVSFSLGGSYGVAVGALGILSTLSIGLTIDSYGPICDNAGGIAEMANLGADVRDRTDALDAAGNTTAAIGKGFAIGSAALVSLALFMAFVDTAEGVDVVDVLEPAVFCGILFGALLPYWFSALTMKSVGKAALAMVEEVRRQFAERPGIMERTQKPDYAECVRISTDASLQEMIAPGALVIMTPILVGFIFGTRSLAGVLVGALVSGVQMAISSSNTGGAWDNAKVCSSVALFILICF